MTPPKTGNNGSERRGDLGIRAIERERVERAEDGRRVWTVGPTPRPHPPFNYCSVVPDPLSPPPSIPSGFSLATPRSLSSSFFSLLSFHYVPSSRPLKTSLLLLLLLLLLLFFAPSAFSLSLSLITLPISARGCRLVCVLVPTPPVMNAMPTNLFFYLSISFLLSSAGAMSAYEVLKSHGLPMGLLPKGVKDFQVDGDGRFEVRLDAACTAKFESQSEVRFNSTVSGTLSYGQIAALSGVAAQELFLWFPVLGIRVDIPSSGIIYFDVGVIYKRFSLSLFETPLDCIPLSSSSSSSEALLPSKNRSGKLRYKLDQEDPQRPVL